MSEGLANAVSPLDGANFDGLVSVREMAPQGMITLRGDLSSSPMRKAATGAGGGAMPEQRQACVGDDGRGILWMSPDELLVLLPYAEVPGALGEMTERLSGHHALAVDVSDARASFELRGNGVREILAKLAPADLSPEALPAGELRRTRLGQVPAAFWLKSESAAQVICFRSVAQYMFDQLKTAAQPGSAVGYF